MDFLTKSLPSTTPVISGALGASLLLYIVLVRRFRWERYDAIHRQYEEKWKKGNLTVAEAQQIMHVSAVYDMPWLLVKALAFALFKTYAVPAVSKLLLQTRQLGSSAKVAKRYTDTEILIQTWVGCPVTGFMNNSSPPDPNTPAEDPRAALAIARTNFLHSKYKISNDDYLFTLGLFIMEPAAWAARFGWRSLSPMEEDAYFIFWKDVGEKMGIVDIPETLAELRAWCEAYADASMVPAKSNKEVAYHTTQELICAVPEALGLKAFAEKVVICLLDDRLRNAFMLPEQPRILRSVVDGLLTSMGVFQRYLMLPRRDGDTSAFPIDMKLPKPDASGDIRQRPAVSVPWYAPVPTDALSSLWTDLQVKAGWYKVPPSKELFCQGYRIEEIGPKEYEHMGVDQVMSEAERLQGCPIAGPWNPKTAEKA